MLSDLVPVFIKILAGIGALLFFIVSVAKARIKQRNKREKKLRKFAENAGMTYQKKQAELERLLKPFELIQKENAEIKITNVLVSRSGELTLFIFDYSWETSGQEGELKKQTAILFDDFCFQFEHFLLRPRKMGDFLESLSGNRDVVPEGNKVFNKKYRLTSQAPRETYYLFTEQLMQFFLQNEKLHAEGLDTFFLIYETGVIIEPVKMQEFLEDNLKGYHQLKKAT